VREAVTVGRKNTGIGSKKLLALAVTKLPSGRGKKSITAGKR
jgi:hypothetical protein